MRVFRALIAVLIAATIWLLKIVFVKVLASSFHVATFFDRMKESVFNHYILETLSGPPLDEEERDLPRRRLQASKTLPARLRDKTYPFTRSKKYGSRRIDMERLRKLSSEARPSAWSVKRLVSYVRSSGLSTISRTVDDFGKAESEINSEWEARNCAQRVFKNVAKSDAKYIDEEDLLKFLKSEEVNTIFPLFEGALETGRITKSSFRNWVVHAYVERKALAHSLNDTKTAVQQLHKLASAIVTVIITVVSLLVMGLATTKVIFVVTSQLLLVGFMFQNMCKTMFESIIFVFVMHPFDVGDRCVVDGIQMIVEEMNILTTVFLRYDNEKIYYPNSVLLTKPISNFRRSPDMADVIDFTIDVSTHIDDINALKKAIQVYLESKPKHWSPKHAVIVREIENVDKMKMALCVQHTMNHQNYGEKNSRRSDLVLELKKIFENLGIKYNFLPQEVHVTRFNVTNGGMAIPS
nr:mechanosensitive ion channel protein 10 [Quercus suber]